MSVPINPHKIWVRFNTFLEHIAHVNIIHRTFLIFNSNINTVYFANGILIK